MYESVVERKVPGWVYIICKPLPNKTACRFINDRLARSDCLPLSSFLFRPLIYSKETNFVIKLELHKCVVIFIFIYFDISSVIYIVNVDDCESV